jgi:hypothetical protein
MIHAALCAADEHALDRLDTAISYVSPVECGVNVSIDVEDNSVWGGT